MKVTVKMKAISDNILYQVRSRKIKVREEKETREGGKQGARTKDFFFFLRCPSTSTSMSSLVARDDLDDESELQPLTDVVASGGNDDEIEGCLDTELDSTSHEAFVVELFKEVTDLIL